MNVTADETVEKLTPAQLRRLMDGDAPALIDVRGYGEYAQSRISTSNCIPLDELPARFGEIPTGGPVVCICASGRRSEAAARQLGSRGIAAMSLAGGLTAWKREGLPIWTSPAWALERQVRVCAGSLVLIGLTIGHFWAPGSVLAWLVGGGLVIAALSNTCLMGRVLMGMPWNRASGQVPSPIPSEIP